LVEVVEEEEEEKGMKLPRWRVVEEWATVAEVEEGKRVQRLLLRVHDGLKLLRPLLRF
jgi:hypothetical protein